MGQPVSAQAVDWLQTVVLYLALVAYVCACLLGLKRIWK